MHDDSDPEGLTQIVSHFNCQPHHSQFPAWEIGGMECRKGKKRNRDFTALFPFISVINTSGRVLFSWHITKYVLDAFL